MPWLRNGTVAVTQNSTTVTGTGTTFTSSRIGDAFNGPDGRRYEVFNIINETVLAIIPPYAGATVSGAAYFIEPVQGYPKALTDVFNTVNQRWGTTLAALGTTGNYDTLPVNKGGTGGANQADARTGLGLGSVSVENTVPVAKGGTGRTDGRAVFSEVGVQQAAALYSVQGMYAGWNASTLGEGHFIVNKGGGIGGFNWRSVNANNSASGPSMSYSYEGLLTVPSLSVTASPIAIASGGTGGNSPATARQGLQLSNSATMPAVGTVGQASGIPTGAIIERGSNTNGEYTRYADGTQICTFKTRTVKTLGNSTGTLFFSSAEPARTFPMPFSTAPAVSITAALESGEGWFAGTGLVLSATQWTAGYVFTQISRTAQQVAVEYVAVGRWF
ncbi:Tail fiber domain-containing protein [Pseudomonas syringae pv. cilantro]|nr:MULTISPECIES: hypothetical protein [Pseudomonas syringae group]KPC32517.1 Tail fiber domain-containing protein [Pseudomonas syringae pv. cilantro]